MRLLPEFSSSIEFLETVSTEKSVLSGIGLMFFDNGLTATYLSPAAKKRIDKTYPVPHAPNMTFPVFLQQHILTKKRIRIIL